MSWQPLFCQRLSLENPNGGLARKAPIGFRGNFCSSLVAVGCLVAPYCAKLQYYRCDTPYRAIPSWGGEQSPKKVRYPPLVLNFTQAHLRAVPCCSISRDNCARPHKNKHQQTRVYPYPLGAGSARPNPKMGAPDPENPSFLEFSVLRDHGLRPWSRKGPDHGVGVDLETVKARKSFARLSLQGSRDMKIIARSLLGL